MSSNPLHLLRGRRPLNGRPVLLVAVRRRLKSRGRGFSLRPVDSTPALSVTYSAAAAAVTVRGAIIMLCLYLCNLPFIIIIIANVVIRIF